MLQQNLKVNSEQGGVSLACHQPRHFSVPGSHIAGLDPRTTPASLSQFRGPPAVTGSLPPWVRLQALELTWCAPYVPFMKLPQRGFCWNWEMMKDATAATEALKVLSGTNHYSLHSTHLWDRACAVKDIAQPNLASRRRKSRQRPREVQHPEMPHSATVHRTGTPDSCLSRETDRW